MVSGLESSVRLLLAAGGSREADCILFTSIEEEVTVVDDVGTVSVRYA